MTYDNPFGGFWVDDPNDPFNVNCLPFPSYEPLLTPEQRTGTIVHSSTEPKLDMG